MAVATDPDQNRRRSPLAVDRPECMGVCRKLRARPGGHFGCGILATEEELIMLGRRKSQRRLRACLHHT